MDLNLAILGATTIPRNNYDSGPWDWEGHFVWPENMGLETVLRKAIVAAVCSIVAFAKVVASPARRAAHA